ncbi:MAG: 30S ribosomal protein S17 [Nanoarchaeota archaeon]
MKEKTKMVENEKKKDLVVTRGRIFEGTVVKKFPKRISIEFERTIYVSKYRRFSKKKTRIHARLPDNLDVDLGDLVKVRECRPLSKIIHHMVTEIVRKSERSPK